MEKHLRYWLPIVCTGVSLLTAVDAAAQTRAPQSLRQVLVECGCLQPLMPEELLAIVTVDYATLREGQTFIVAFWTSLDWESKEPLQLVSGNTQTGQWRRARIPLANTYDRSRIASIRRLGGLVFVYLAYSIDDFAIPVLTADLEPRGTVYGVIDDVWPNGVVKYAPHQPHFGPHQVGIGLFDSRTGMDRQIFPPENCQPIRCGYVDRLRTAGAGPYPFVETESVSREVLSWRDRALAFVVVFRQGYPMTTPPGWTEEQTVMVVCDRLDLVASSRCRETPLAKWRKVFPGVPDEQLAERAAANPTRIEP